MTRNDSGSFYSKKLFASKLRKAYEIASPRIQQYLDAEIQYVIDHLQASDTVLELGCGYGRVLKRLAKNVNRVVGIDIAKASLKYAEIYLVDHKNIDLHYMTARSINFAEKSFESCKYFVHPGPAVR